MLIAHGHKMGVQRRTDYWPCYSHFHILCYICITSVPLFFTREVSDGDFGSLVLSRTAGAGNKDPAEDVRFRLVAVGWAKSRLSRLSIEVHNPGSMWLFTKYLCDGALRHTRQKKKKKKKKLLNEGALTAGQGSTCILERLLTGSGSFAHCREHSILRTPWARS